MERNCSNFTGSLTLRHSCSCFAGTNNLIITKTNTVTSKLWLFDVTSSTWTEMWSAVHYEFSNLGGTGILANEMALCQDKTRYSLDMGRHLNTPLHLHNSIAQYCSGQTMYNTAVDATHNLLYVATSGGNSAGRSIIELPLTITGESMPFKARKK